MSLYFVSLAVAIINPISALMLAYMVLHYKIDLRLGVVARLLLSLMVVGLLVQAAEQVELLTNYRPPRSYGWIATMGALNGLILALFVRRVWKGVFK